MCQKRNDIAPRSTKMFQKSVIVLFATLVSLENCFVLAAKPPNILLILADDYGWNDVGYHGSEIRTPTLDRLAAQGVKLQNYYVQPICSPTRSQLLSGRYQIHTGLQHGVIKPQQPNALPKNLPTLADMLKAQGYSTHIVGKWHLGFYKQEYMPTFRGFDSHYGYLVGAEDYFTHVREGGLDFRHNLDIVTDKNGSYSTEVFAERASSLIKTHSMYNSDKPLFLYLPFQSVHAPLEVPDRYLKQYSFIKNDARRTYAGMVSALDEAIFNVTMSLKRFGLWDNTLVIFSTDNGGQVYMGGNNWPLRGWKDQLWEGGVRAVGFVSGPFLGREGATSSELIHVSDWFPTLVHLAGGNCSHLALDGYNVWPVISQGKNSDRKMILHNIDPLCKKHGRRWTNTTFDNRVRAALRYEDWKLLTGFPGVGTYVPPPVSSAEPNIVNTTAEPDKDVQNVWLYNIKSDPLEKHDLTDHYPDLVQALLETLAYYNSTAVPCRYPPYDSQSNPKLHGGVWGPWL